MGQRILIFENEESFAQELKTEFEKLGVVVDLVSDGPTGLEQASEAVPDLILLTIELPGMNGFLVCKKIKKTESLRDIPLIILSGEASAETFEQHSKLRTHAQLYLHKPISFGEVLESAKKFISIEPQELEEEYDEIEEVLEVEDEMIVISEDGIGDSTIPSEEATYIVDDVDKFANDTFESLMTEKEAKEIKDGQQEVVAAAEPAAPSVSEAMADEAQSAGDAVESEPDDFAIVEELEDASVVDDGSSEQLLSIVEDEPASDAESDKDADELERLRLELENAQTQIVDLKNLLQSNESSSQVVSSGTSDRGYLDLKEQLNKKDRELLNLREQVSARDKQLLESSDENLKLARELADIKDSFVALEREMSGSREHIQMLVAEKESAKKRFEELRAQLERIEAKARELEGELDATERNAAEKIEHAENACNIRLEESQRVHEEEVRSMREEMEEKHATELKSAEEKHSRELAVVVRSISEAETKLANAEDNILQLEEDKKKMQESLDNLETAQKEKDERIESLVKRLEEISEKMENDKELLERVHRAMAIGIGLLEEQKQTTLDS